MKKIVIVNGRNSCCFNLSSEIIKRYFELSNMSKPYFYIRKQDCIYEIGGKSLYERVDSIENYFYVSLNDLGKEVKHENMLFEDDNYFEPSSILRDDINLVKAVEEINPENLKIVEIPDDVNWYIREEDDGFESIEEVHRSWY